MIRLDDLALFVRSAALGSFSQAAREVNLLPGQASAAIQRLERELDIRLFARSTRSLRLTEEGKRYLPYAQDALQALREGAMVLYLGDQDFSYHHAFVPFFGVPAATVTALPELMAASGAPARLSG